MEENNYNEFIDAHDTDLAMAARRYSDEIEKINEIYARHYPTENISDYLHVYPDIAGYMSYDVSGELAEIKRNLNYLQEELSEIKRILSKNTEKLTTLEYRKITL